MQSEINKEIDELNKKCISGIFQPKCLKSIEWFKAFMKQHGLNPLITPSVLSSSLISNNPPQMSFPDSNFGFADDTAAHLFLEQLKRTGKIEFPLYYALVHYFEEKFEEFDGICGV